MQLSHVLRDLLWRPRRLRVPCYHQRFPPIRSHFAFLRWFQLLSIAEYSKPLYVYCASKEPKRAWHVSVDPRRVKCHHFAREDLNRVGQGDPELDEPTPRHAMTS